MGLSLFSAQQYASHVHPRILCNASTRVVGRLTTEESGRPDYRFLSKEQRSWLSHLEKGGLLLDHAPMGRAIKINFPRPTFRLGG